MTNNFQGKLNLTDLPPPITDKIYPGLYFPSFYPPWEKIIKSRTQEYEIVWPQWSGDRRKPIEELMMSATKSFGTQFVALSFFNEEYEVLKAENGYNVKYIQRDISFAAHALLSTDVFIILDTKKVRFALHERIVKLTLSDIPVQRSPTCH